VRSEETAGLYSEGLRTPVHPAAITPTKGLRDKMIG
jgi:hypothetical protein